MGAEISIPIAISLLGLVLADSDGLAISYLSQKSMRLEDRSKIRSRLKQLGRGKDEDYENFRLAQFSLISLVVVVTTSAFLIQLISFAIFLIVILLGSAFVVIGFERNLSNRCKRRSERIESEFPSFIEMLTLAAGAGESPISSMKRLSARAHGELAREFSQVVQNVEAGQPFSIALDAMSHQLGSTTIRRFVDSMIISISRGTPLVDTLSHSVQESRNHERVRLMNAAGKAEINMMIPVVFLILPISILFALFPSLNALNFYGG
jgi:tight adherence protein C